MHVFMGLVLCTGFIDFVGWANTQVSNLVCTEMESLTLHFVDAPQLTQLFELNLKKAHYANFIYIEDFSYI